MVVVGVIGNAAMTRLQWLSNLDLWLFTAWANPPRLVLCRSARMQLFARREARAKSWSGGTTSHTQLPGEPGWMQQCVLLYHKLCNSSICRQLNSRYNRWMQYEPLSSKLAWLISCLNSFCCSLVCDLTESYDGS